MRVAASWLNSYLEKDLKAEALVTALTAAGVEVDEVIAPPQLDPAIVVVEVLKLEPHPQADRLKLATVSDGKSQLKVVCGAANVAKGQKVALARVGAKLPYGQRIGVTKIRGVESQGMLCSELELGWGDDHTGIVELDPASKPGTAVTDLPRETVLVVTTPANRPDLLSMIGLAREVAAQHDIDLYLPEGDEINEVKPLKLGMLDKQKVARYLLCQLELPARLADSPDWLRQRLVAAGMRPVNLVVDITNYAMLEWGQPLHAFAATAIKGEVGVRLAKSGEKITTLDGKERDLTTHDLVITDARGPIGLAGVMGAAASEVTEQNHQKILLEAASFDAVTIRQTAIHHGLRTEASARFERGLPVQLAPVALARAVNLFIELADAKLSAYSDQLHVWPWVQHVGARVSRLSALSGIELTPQTIVDRLLSLGFSAERFDIVEEAKRHAGKPYKFGANFKQDGVAAFDCSYLTDYIYSLIGVAIGHTAHQQSKQGRAVGVAELRPGDILFRGGPWHNLDSKEREGVSHNALYIGDGKIIDARDYQRVGSKWQKLAAAEQKVTKGALEDITEDPEFLGARRYVDNIEDYVAVTVPWWRTDIKSEEDVWEEVIKLVGYDNIPATLPVWRGEELRLDRYWPLVWQLKEYLRSLGHFEVATYSFVSRRLLEAAGYQPTKHLKLKNARSQEQEHLRSDLLPSLLAAVAKNVRHAERFGLFEVSQVFSASGKQVIEHNQLALVVREEADQAYLAAKAALDLVMRQLGVTFTLKKQASAGLQENKAASIGLGTQPMGRIGEVDPAVLDQLRIKDAVGYLELDIELLLKATQPRVYRPINRYPVSQRDLAVVVPLKVWWQDVAAAIEEQELAAVSFVSDWRGAELGTGHKSLALRLSISAPDRTLTEAEVAERVDQVLKLLQQRFGAQLKE